MKFFKYWSEKKNVLDEEKLKLYFIATSTDKFRLFDYYYRKNYYGTGDFDFLIDTVGHYSLKNKIYTTAIITNHKKEVLSFKNIFNQNDIDTLITNYKK